MQLICKVCGKKWEAETEPARCPDRKECGSRHWKAGIPVAAVQVAVQSTVQLSKAEPVQAVQAAPLSKPLSKLDSPPKPWNGQATSEYRQCRECGKEFRSNKDLPAMAQHVDHLAAVHRETGWGEAYARIQATKHKSQPQYSNANR